MLFDSVQYSTASILSGHFKGTLNGVCRRPTKERAEPFEVGLNWGNVAKKSNLSNVKIVRVHCINNVINNISNFKVFQSIKELFFRYKTMGSNFPMLVLPILIKVFMFKVHL
jgi:hypothetical protein